MEKRVWIYSLIGLLVLVGLIIFFSSSNNSNSSSSGSNVPSSSGNQQPSTDLGSPTYSCLSIDYATKKPTLCTQLYENSPNDQFESVKKSCESLASLRNSGYTWSTNPCPSEGATICDLKVYKNYLYDEDAVNYAKSKGQC